MKKRFFRVLSITLFIIGLFLIDPNPVGSVIGVLSQTSSSIIGIFFVLISGLLFVESVEDKKDVVEKDLHLSPSDASKLAKGKLVVKDILNKNYRLVVVYRLEDKKLNAGLFYVHANDKIPKSGTKAMNAFKEFRRNAIKAGGDLGFKETDIYILSEANKKFFDRFRRDGYRDTQTCMFNKGDSTLPMKGVVRHYKAAA